MAEDLNIQKSPLTRLREYVADVRVEMKRVTWPSKQEIYGTTVMVVLTTFLFGFYFYICDDVFSLLVATVLRFFSHRS
jgi:preprotein translocase subunit SecE